MFPQSPQSCTRVRARDSFDFAAVGAGHFDPAQRIGDGVVSASLADQLVELRRQDRHNTGAKDPYHLNPNAVIRRPR